MMIFRSDMQLDMQKRQIMLSRARRALDHDLITPFYQPQIDLASGRIAGFEALLRWREKGGRVQFPATIAAAFEDLDLAAAISDSMIERVLIDARAWLDAGIDFGHVAVNASAAEFRRGRFAEQLLERLDQAGVPTRYFQLEVTETVFLGRGAECVDHALKKLSAAGVKITLDEFGTGYASLSHLKQFPVDVIKIDQSFVRVLETDVDAKAIIRAVIHLGQSLNIEVVAEGVETDAQQDFLVSQGCDQGQGFLYSKAVPAPKVQKFLESWAHRQSTCRLLGRGTR
jgi:EAL domain-containing protein (putative c-di-GMP-specific phosphodiesterase class I)